MSNYRDVHPLIDCLMEISECDCPNTKSFFLNKIACLYKLSDRVRPVVNKRLMPYTEYCDSLGEILHPFKFPYQ